jgi:hypothetical protein
MKLEDLEKARNLHYEYSALELYKDSNFAEDYVQSHKVSLNLDEKEKEKLNKIIADFYINYHINKKDQVLKEIKKL